MTLPTIRTTNPYEPYATCYDLVDGFLEDYYPHLQDDARVTRLTETILAWLAHEHDNYEPPSGAPQDDPDFAGFADNH
jgi:hypothetical protein